jgi:Domain of unknown function (DUF6484)
MATTVENKPSAGWRTGGVPEIGVLVDIGADGTPMVEYGGEDGPVSARTAIPSASRGDIVLLLFDHGDLRRPIIIGIVRDTFEGFPKRLKIAAKELLIEGAETVTLRCGESSLTLRRDGKTVLKGKEVVSRASRTNRIKGSTVQIN